MPAVATVVGNTLEVSVDGIMPDRQNSMVITEPIEIDSATAAAFGMRNAIIVPGSYDVVHNDDSTDVIRYSVMQRTSSVSNATSSAGTASPRTEPNPVAGTTTLRFNLARTSPVTIDLIDSRGHHVSRLVDDVWMSAGEQSLAINASELTNGVYFFSIRTNGSMMSGRMVVAK
jgi:hypothetical protein